MDPNLLHRGLATVKEAFLAPQRVTLQLQRVRVQPHNDLPGLRQFEEVAQKIKAVREAKEPGFIHALKSSLRQHPVYGLAGADAGVLFCIQHKKVIHITLWMSADAK